MHYSRRLAICRCDVGAVVSLTFILFSIYAFWPSGELKIIDVVLPAADLTSFPVTRLSQPESTNRIVILMPSTPRSDRAGELLALSNVFKTIPNLLWIVVDDTGLKAKIVETILKESGVDYLYLSTNNTGLPCRGWDAYNSAFEYMRANSLAFRDNDVVYPVPDNTAFGFDFFETHVRPVQKVGVWNVGFFAHLVQKPELRNGKVVGWSAKTRENQKFDILWGGFALSIKYILRSDFKFTLACAGHSAEDCLLSGLNISMSDFEGRGPTDDKVFVWRRSEKRGSNTRYPTFGYLADKFEIKRLGIPTLLNDMCGRFGNLKTMTQSEAEYYAQLLQDNGLDFQATLPEPRWKDIYYTKNADSIPF